MLAEMLRDSIRQGTTPSLTIISNSMSPLLRAGDKVGLQELNLANAQPGQIITFLQEESGAKLITHRIAGMFMENGENKIATFGDRSLLFDYPTAHGDIVGQVAWRQRNDRILNLITGRGAWLSEKLAREAKNNLVRTSGFRSDQQALDSDALLLANKKCQQQRKKLGTRICLRFRYLWAFLLVAYTQSLTRLGQEN